MSHHLTNHAWEIELRAMQKIVLLALSHLAPVSTRECTPTARRLAFQCGMSESAVREQLDQLEAAGYVERLYGDGPTVYRVNVLPQGDA